MSRLPKLSDLEKLDCETQIIISEYNCDMINHAILKLECF